MKFKSLVILSIISVLTVACSSQPNNQAQTQQTASTAQETTQASTQSGTFKAGEHPTQGTVSVITENGKRYLQFDQSFKTVKGPDLFVILYTNKTVPIGGLKAKDYTTVAALQKISGTQRYALADNVNLANYKSVVVWCRQFNANFGYAPLSS